MIYRAERLISQGLWQFLGLSGGTRAVECFVRFYGEMRAGSG